MDQRRITDVELKSLETLLQLLIQDSQLITGLSILERQEIEKTCETVRSLIDKSMTVRDRPADSIPPDADSKSEE